MAFIERELPRAFSINAIGGPGYMTDVKAGDSGFEQRNQRWDAPLASWNIAFSGKDQTWYDALQNFFHAVRGKANSFRMFWHADFQAEGEFVADGDGTTQAFQLQKTYAAGFDGFAQVRAIQKPITSAVLDYLGNPLDDTVQVFRTRNGATTTLTPVTDYALDETTGVVTFTTAPRSAAQNVAASAGTLADIITWSGEFHWPVRLDIDQLQPKLLTPADGGIRFTVDNLTLKEVRIKPGSAS